ncbi:hypothetical protein LTR28_002189, partial [Elasticomyces elasticus]
YRDHLVAALDSVWNELGIKRTSEWAAQGGFVGVGVPDAQAEEPLWTDEQLGLKEIEQSMQAGQGALGVLENVLEIERKEVAHAVAAAA